MKWSFIGLALGALVVVGAVLSLPSCGHDQKLVSLTVQPSAGFTFPVATAGGTAQYSAIATYIHPPATKDVTSQATWAVDDNVVAISTGVVTTNGNCGTANVSATMPEGTGGASNIVIGYSFVTVNNPAVATCPGGGTEGTLSVQISPPGAGMVASLTYGINCPSVSCITEVPVGASVALTATPAAGYNFGSWQGCTTTATNSCTVTIPTGGAGLVATFTPQ
jgi:Divergent InlB B-repeat domain